MILSNVNLNVKSDFFKTFIEESQFAHFSSTNKSRLKLNLDSKFSDSEQLFERLSTLVKVLLTQSSKSRSSTLVERILLTLARRLSEFYTFHSESSNLVEYFYLLAQTYKHYFVGKTVKTDYDKKFLRDVFLEMFLLKMMLKEVRKRGGGEWLVWDGSIF